MIIQLNTDKNISGTEQLEEYVSREISSGLKHYSSKISRIEVHLSDQNANKAGVNDIQCKIEARIKGLQPIAVNSKDSEKEKALEAAIDKLKATLKTTLGKMQDK